SAETKKLYSAVAQLSTDMVLLRAENQGLRQAIVNEKKKRTRARPVFDDLRAENDGIKAQFFSPSKIQRARDLQIQKEQEKSDLQAQKQEERLERTRRKEEKERLLMERRIQRLEARTLREQEKAR
ncbi:hypothetical protein P152DRAFT_378669, partial [Eremomyces bilateralis CBS 781.70]